MGNNFAMNDQSLSRSFSVREDKRDEFFHSSTYAGAQNAGRIGAAANGKSIAERQDLNENRQFVRGYENASLASQITAARGRAMSNFEREKKSALDSTKDFENTTPGGIDSMSPRGNGQRTDGGVGTENQNRGGYRYSEDRKNRQETGGYGGTDLAERREQGGADYRDYTAAAKQNFGQNYTKRNSAAIGTGAPNFGQRFAPDFGRSVERGYRQNTSNSGIGNKGTYAGQNGVGRIGSQGAAISNTQRFTNNNFRMKFGPGV